MINSIKADTIIRGILESPNESRTIEFKPSIPWPQKIDDLQNNDKAQEIIKSILAMSNLRDGGKIILGIEKNEQKQDILKGMKHEDLGTYGQDLIYQQVRNFGNPEPQFEVLNIEFKNMNFIVFSVQSFIFAPVICNNYRNLNKLETATIYIRTYKPETKKVTEPYEMREIIELAIEKELDLFSARMQRVFKTMSHIKVPKSTEDEQKKFAEELKDIL